MAIEEHSQSRKNADRPRRENQNQAKGAVCEHADENHGTVGNLAFPNRKDSKKNRHHSAKENEKNVSHRDSGDKSHRKKNREINKGSSQVRLGKNKPHRNKHDSKRDKKPLALILSLFRAVKIPCEEEDEYNLSEFRRLNSEWADTKPASCTIYIAAEKFREDKDSARPDEQMWHIAGEATVIKQ